MENLHENYGEARFDFEINELTATMIQSIVSFKCGFFIKYHELTVIQISAQRCTVQVNSTGRQVEFCMP